MTTGNRFAEENAAMSAPVSGPPVPLSLGRDGPDRLVIEWSDGHDSGIYTLEHLRALCQCDECRANP